MKLWKKLLIVFTLFVLAMIVAGMVWSASSSYSAEPAVQAYLESSDRVLVVRDGWVSFQPTDQSPKVGFIFYPGGNVDHLAYAPPLHEIAAQGFLVVNVPMPFNLAVLAPEKALDVIEAYPGIETWVIGGHSLGGAMAARLVYTHPDEVQGLVLWAAYPADSDSLAASETPVLSLYGTMDGVASPRKIERRFELLPEETRYLALEGANHAQFGFYGAQNRDNPPEITRQEQQTLIVNATVDFLRSFEP